MVLLEIPDLLFEQLMSDVGNFTERVTIVTKFSEGLTLETDSKYQFKLLSPAEEKAINLLKNCDHILLLKQFKIIADLQEYEKKIHWSIDKSLDLEQLEGIANLMGTVHDLLHAADPSIPDPDDGCYTLLG